MRKIYKKKKNQKLYKMTRAQKGNKIDAKSNFLSFSRAQNKQKLTNQNIISRSNHKIKIITTSIESTELERDRLHRIGE